MGWEFAPLRSYEKKLPWAAEGREYLQNILRSTTEYPLQQVASLSPYETQGLAGLSDILAGKAFQDPRTSPYYQGMREEIASDTEKGVSALRHRQGMAGMFRSSPGLREEGEFRADMGSKALQILGSLYESERARDNPYTRVQAAMDYGSLPRLLEQARADAGYQQQLQNFLGPAWQQKIPLALQLMGYAPLQQASYQADEPSTLTQILGGLSGAAGVMGGVGNLMGGLGIYKYLNK
jgi:hypothetical protein